MMCPSRHPFQTAFLLSSIATTICAFQTTPPPLIALHHLASSTSAPLVNRSTNYFCYSRNKNFSRLYDLPTSPSSTSATASSPTKLSKEIPFQELFVMDVVLFQRRRDDPDKINSNKNNDEKLELGAFQENKSIAPLSAWTLESAYTSSNSDTDMMEFVVDEEDLFPGLGAEDVTVWKVLDGSVVSYGSRQVGGGKGPGNPHGEESELLYYVDRGVVEGRYLLGGEGLEMTVDVVVNPNLEHLWWRISEKIGCDLLKTRQCHVVALEARNFVEGNIQADGSEFWKRRMCMPLLHILMRIGNLYKTRRMDMQFTSIETEHIIIATRTSKLEHDCFCAFFKLPFQVLYLLSCVTCRTLSTSSFLWRPHYLMWSFVGVSPQHG